MLKTFAMSASIVAASALPVFAETKVDPDTVTCKNYNEDTHAGMIATAQAMMEALKADPAFAAMTESQMTSAVDNACSKHSDATVRDALHM